MGTCISREARQRRKDRKRHERRLREARHASSPRDHTTTSSTNRFGHRSRSEGANGDVRDDIKELIIETLEVIRTLVNNEQEPPQSLLKLNFIADEEKGWMLVVRALIYTVSHSETLFKNKIPLLIPENDPLGPAVISLFLDECPLPSKESVQTLLHSLGLSKDFVDTKHLPPSWHKNMCIVLGSLAEKMAGTAALWVDVFPEFVWKIIERKNTHCVRMFALLALEKFAQTRENQITIGKMFGDQATHPLLKMEEYLRNEDVVRYWHAKQEGFCAQWALDNIFVLDARPYSYETTDTSQINAMLNHEDVSEYLKIGPDGLEARCDVSSFESVRCTFEVMDGTWYYEATVLTSGVMQIGLATKRSRFLNHEGYGIGDDASSVAYDGCRQLVWYNAKSQKHEHENWQPGDVIGVLLNIPEGEVVFYLNGTPLKEPNTEFLSNRQPSEGVFAAASFMSFQQCRFNFGASRFKYNPGKKFRAFNDFGKLTTAQRTIIPRRLRLEQLQKEHIPDDYCTICFGAPASTRLEPCHHDGFCSDCCNMMEHCPLCRTPIRQRVAAQKSNNNSSSKFDTFKSPSHSSINGHFQRVNSQRKSIRATSAIADSATDTPIRSTPIKDAPASTSASAIARRHTQV
uniref:RING finger and SPRY domain-containing protein 1 n=1 Tax=Caenorhabditis tropicalis TaxID=1561998 RepID=A0A1I7UJH2_9PELO